MHGRRRAADHMLHGLKIDADPRAAAAVNARPVLTQDRRLDPIDASTQSRAMHKIALLEKYFKLVCGQAETERSDKTWTNLRQLRLQVVIIEASHEDRNYPDGCLARRLRRVRVPLSRGADRVVGLTPQKSAPISHQNACHKAHIHRPMMPAKTISNRAVIRICPNRLRRLPGFRDTGGVLELPN